MPKTSPKNKAVREELPRVFAQEYLNNGMNASKAISKIKPHLKDTKSRYVMAHKWLIKDNTQQAIRDLLRGDKQLMNKTYRNLHEIADAKLITTKDNKAVIHEDIPDYAERRKISHTILELIDAFPARRIEQKTLKVSLQYDGLSEEDLIQKYEEKLAEMKQK